MPASTFFRQAICNVIRQGQAGAASIALITPSIALFNGDPSVSGTEVTATIRPAGRVGVTFGTAPTNGVMSNTVAVSFGNASGAATVTHFAIFDSATVGSGNMILFNALSNGSQSITAGNPVSFAVGAITVTIT